MRPTRIFVAVLAFTLLAGCSVLAPDTEPDGWTKVVLTATDPTGETASADRLRQAEQTLSRRAQAAGLGKPSFVSAADGRIEMLIPGRRESDVVTSLVAAGQLRMRRVLDLAAPSPTGQTTPQASPSAVTKGSLPTAQSVIAQLGEAATVAASLTGDPVPPAVAAALEPFAALTPAQLAVLPASMLLRVPQVGCGALNRRPTGFVDNPTVQVVACDDAGVKYVLDVAAVDGTDVAKAEASLQEGTTAWVVTVSFTAAGQARFTALSQLAYDNSGNPTCGVNAVDSAGHCAVGIVSDNVVLSAPHIQGVLTGDAVISGSFTQQSAKSLAAQLTSGALPVTFAVESVTVTS